MTLTGSPLEKIAVSVAGMLIFAIVVSIAGWVFWVSDVAAKMERHLDSYSKLEIEVEAIDRNVSAVKEAILVNRTRQGQHTEALSEIRTLLYSQIRPNEAG